MIIQCVEKKKEEEDKKKAEKWKKKKRRKKKNYPKRITRLRCTFSGYIFIIIIDQIKV